MGTSSAEDFRAQMVMVAPGIALPRRSTCEWGDYTVVLEVEPQDGRLVATEVVVRQREGGPPVTSEALRSVPVASLTTRTVWQALRVTAHEGYQEWKPFSLNREEMARLRENGPTRETLEWVARLYRLALLLAEPPTKSVATALAVPRSTAGRWVAAARTEGFLSAAEGPGKAGG